MGSEGSTVKERLLKSATEVFGEFGFKGATIREICRRAGVGISLVNYYFRDKEGLYLEVYRELFTGAIREYPPDMGLDENAVPEDRLSAFIRSFLYRMTMVGGRHSLIMRELLDPSPSLIRLHRELAMPLQKTLTEILTELLDPQCCEEDLGYCATSIIGQCMFYGPSTQRFRQRIFSLDSDEKIELVTSIITAFSLGGIRAINEKEHTKGVIHEA
ncbi:MAG: CerR family C-terminal domain-containing protein [Deltaproteobacteria bacterium]|nr:CerR family C-terminal domain-containing protein [Deltaproteobacteria bacterium]